MKARKNPRRTAIEILAAWEGSGASLTVVRDRMFRRFPLADARDRGLVNMLIFGLMRQLNRIDFFLSRRSERPLARLDKKVRAALRLGIFELYGPGKDRGGGVVNETVAAVKAAGAPKWQAGFVNAVMRGFVADGFPELPGDRGLALGHPGWMLARWEKDRGADMAAEIAAENNRRPDLCLRARPGRRPEFMAKLAAAGFSAAATGIAAAGVRLAGFNGRIFTLPGYKEGEFSVQDEAAQLVAEIALAGGAAGAKNILDACAGVGGKSCHLADLGGPDAVVVALEPEVSRRELLTANIKRFGLGGRIKTKSGHIADLAPARGNLFDLVLVDAPCSGLGVIRRHPDIRWNRNPGDIASLAARQKELLRQAAALVRPGGHLVYAACSFEPEETVALINDFLAVRPLFSLEDPGNFCRLPPPSACGTAFSFPCPAKWAWMVFSAPGCAGIFP